MFDGSTMIIDGEKLKNELAKRNVLPKDAGKELGVSRSTVQGWISREKLPRYGLKLLEKVYNIHFEDIKKVEIQEDILEKEDTSEYDKSYNEYLSVINNNILAKLDLIDEHIVELTTLLKGIWA